MTKLEQMTYKMQPAGHEENQPKRKYAKPSRELSNAFEKWLNHRDKVEHVGEWYVLANHCLEGIEATIEDAYPLLLQYQDHPSAQDTHHPRDRPSLRNAGIFLSAIYNKQPKKLITFDADIGIPLDHVGYKLDKDKQLVALTRTGNYLGEYAEGTVLNYGITGFDTAVESDCLFVNYSKAEDFFGKKMKGIVVNLGRLVDEFTLPMFGYRIDYETPDDERRTFAESALSNKFMANDMKSWEKNNLIIEHMITHQHKKIPELWNYLMELKRLLEPGKEDYNKALAAIETLGPEPGKKIKTTIDEMFRRKGYNVA